MYTDNTHSPAYLVSPELLLTYNRSYCLSFWYYVYGQPASAQLLVFIKRSQMNGRPEWSRIIGSTSEWTQAQITIDVTAPLQVIFGADFSNNFSGLAIDDISLLQGQCSGGVYESRVEWCEGRWGGKGCDFTNRS